MPGPGFLSAYAVADKKRVVCLVAESEKLSEYADENSFS